MIEIINWGLVDYRQALKKQEDLVGMVARGEHADALVFCTHPPVVTIGRVTPESDYADWSGELVEVSRGGRATYHGPNQIVVYPIISLDRERSRLPVRDLHAYLGLLGEAIVLTAKNFGIDAVYKQGEEKVPDTFSGSQGVKRHLTGVWVGDKKLASIGVAARQWVTFHGLALNVSSGREGFTGIQPCGFTPDTMTSMEEALGKNLDRADIERKLAHNLSQLLVPV